MYEITRVYDNPTKVEATILRLRAEGFTDDDIQVTTPTSQRREWVVSVHHVFGMGRLVTDILDRYEPLTDSGNYVVDPHAHDRGVHAHAQRRSHAHREPGVDAIAALSGHRSPGAIHELSGHVRPGAIATLSGHQSPGAIARLSQRVSPGAISRLSGWVSPGAISRLSAPKPAGAVASMASGWYVSRLFGLPLLTRSHTGQN
jgi:hypothetical protein